VPRVPLERHLAIARLRVGGRQSDVARGLGVSQSVISRLVSRHRTTGTVHDRPRSGAPRVTERNDDQYLRTYARLPDVRGTRVTPLTPRHRRERLQWTQDHVTWTMQQWSTVLFADECRVTLHRMMVVSVAGEGEVSDMPRLTWSPGFALVEEVQRSGQASPASTKQIWFL
uniref:Transposase Tc1-like domain-containing protein n=1 Tax=Stegastes partitus TaxID=144197 RepID=A0A3B4Z9U4_9TELE